MVSGRTVVRNTIVSGLSRLALAGIAYVLTPFLLHRLGVSGYGIWMLASTFTFEAGYLALTDLGLKEATVRRVAREHGRGEEDSATVGTAVWLSVGLGCVFGLMLLRAVTWLVDQFGIEPELVDDARWVFFAVAASVIVEVGTRLTWAALVVMLVSSGGGLRVLGGTYVGVAVLRLVVSAAAAWRASPGFARSLMRFDVRVVRELTSAGSVLFAYRFTGIVWRQMDRIILGVALSAVAVAEYDVASKVHAIAVLVMSVVPAAVVPASAHLDGRDDRRVVRELYLKGTRYAVAVVVPLAMALIVLADLLVEQWVGKEFAHVVTPTRLLLAYPAIVVVHQVGLNVLVGLNRMRVLLRLNLLAVTLNLSVSMALVGRYGINGVVVGSLVGFGFLFIPYTRLFLREFDVTARQWARAFVTALAPPAVVATALAFLLRLAFTPSSLLVTLTWCVVASAAGTGSFYVTLPAEERSQLRAAVGRGRS